MNRGFQAHNPWLMHHIWHMAGSSSSFAKEGSDLC